tara:strand:+ start:357 stop:623 length:267 start_codon:yes stop_codon:yes gene_type:complete
MKVNGIKCKTQEQAVLEYLKTGKPISQDIAYEVVGTQRLGAIIWKLRNRGYDISSINSKGKNRFGNNVNFCLYHLSMTQEQIRRIENE